MRWLQIEYILKGVYLGLLFFVALQEPAEMDRMILCTLGGLILCLGITAIGKLREGYRIKGRIPAFLLFLLMESPELTYLGILGGAAVGAFLVPKTVPEQWLLPALIVGGALLGLGFWVVPHFKNRWVRFVVSLLVAFAPVGLFFGWEWWHGAKFEHPSAVGMQLLLGLPFFYIMTLAGRAEESEAEIGAICAGVSLGLYLLQIAPYARSLVFVVPLAVYYAYTTRYLPSVRIFKHVMRGMSYASVGRHRHAILVFRRAIELDPQNKMAREGLMSVHRAIDLNKATKDPELLPLVDVDLCLSRASALLMEARPSEKQLEEAHKLLDFVLSQRPDRRATILYWQAVAQVKTKNYEKAAEELTSVLNPADQPASNPERDDVLLKSWHLALIAVGEMQKRVGSPLLALPGKRLAAIGVVERSLAAHADNPPAWDLKRLLYSQLTEGEYNQVIPKDKAASDFDHAYTQQLGLALINDRGRWERGAEFLRIAARGLPAQGPSIYVQIAQAADRAGDAEASWHNYRLAQWVGRTAGPKNLTPEDKQAYFATVKMLAEDAARRNDLDAAIESWQLYAENERSGLETLRMLAGLYEKKLDMLGAVRATEQALIYDSNDADLLKKKDSYYYSVALDELKAHVETARKYFDVPYCLRKAKGAIDAKNSDLDMIEYGLHLAEVAQIVKPKDVTAMVLRARGLLRKGERDKALMILEDLRETPPEKMDGEDEDSWFVANRLLGDLYLNELSRPDLALLCYTEFRKSAKSGADTLYKLGQAYEASGDLKKAARYYEQVTAYEGHPLAYDARQALSRVKESAPQ